MRKTGFLTSKNVVGKMSSCSLVTPLGLRRKWIRKKLRNLREAARLRSRPQGRWHHCYLLPVTVMMKKVNQSSLRNCGTMKIPCHCGDQDTCWRRLPLNCKTMKKHAGRCPQKTAKHIQLWYVCQSPFHTHLLDVPWEAEHRRISTPSYSSCPPGPLLSSQQSLIPSQLAKGKCNLQSLIPSSQNRANKGEFGAEKS